MKIPTDVKNVQKVLTDYLIRQTNHVMSEASQEHPTQEMLDELLKIASHFKNLPFEKDDVLVRLEERVNEWVVSCEKGLAEFQQDITDIQAAMPGLERAEAEIAAAILWYETRRSWSGEYNGSNPIGRYYYTVHITWNVSRPVARDVSLRR